MAVVEFGFLASALRRLRRAGRTGRTGFATACAIALLCACTDLQVAARPVDPQFALPQGGAFRFAREPLAGVQRASDAARAGDAGARAAIAEALGARGLRPAGPAEAAVLVVEFTLRDGIAANVARLDGPSDYRRSWRGGSQGDGTGAMDHTVADSAFRRELELTVLLRSGTAAVVAWEGRASRSVAPDYPDAGLGRVLGRMCARLFAELP